MLKDRKLKTQFQVAFGSILVAGIVATILTYVVAGVVFLALQNKELYPANYYEKQLPAIENYVWQQNTALLSTDARTGLEKVVPAEGISYQVVDGDGRILYGTYRTQVIENREQLYSRLNITSGYQGKYILTVPIIGGDAKISGAVLLAYELKVTSPDGNIRRWIIGLFILAVVAPFFYIILFTVLFSRKLTKNINRPLQMLMAAAKKIGERDPNFEIDYHANNEIGNLCNAFSDMQKELKNSLSTQWKIEQERTEMVEALAHDLKTPMSVIQGYSEALLDSTLAEGEKEQRYLTVIHENAEKASALVRQMQSSSELENSSVELNLQEVNVKEFLTTKIQAYEMRSEQKRIPIAADISDELNSLYRIDPEKLGRVLDNLLSNCLQYTPEGGNITITAGAETEHIRFTVVDSGPGFCPQELTRVFGRFYRGDASHGNDQGHSGLGLYIARQLVKKIGGAIQASNVEPHGAMVEFTIETQESYMDRGFHRL